jgi:hypothetical protein
VSLFNEPIVKLLASYIYKAHIAGNNFISVADAYPVLYPDGLMIYRFGKMVNDTLLQHFGSMFYHQAYDVLNENFTMADRLWNFTALKDVEEEKGNAPSLKDVWLNSVQLMVSRTANGLFVASHAGHNAESHNHNDVGDVILYCDGSPVIIDVGSGTYISKTFSKDRYTLWYNTSGYHNVPLINGFQQQDGRQFEAKNVRYSSTSPRSELQMDIAAAYPAESGIKQWIRTVTVEKKLNRLIVKDNYLSDNPLKQLTQTFMTVCPADIQQPGKIFFNVGKEMILMEYDANKWAVSKEEALTNSPDEKQLEINWGHHPIWRLLFTSKTRAAKDNFTYTFRKAERK